MTSPTMAKETKNYFNIKNLNGITLQRSFSTLKKSVLTKTASETRNKSSGSRSFLTAATTLL